MLQKFSIASRNRQEAPQISWNFHDALRTPLGSEKLCESSRIICDAPEAPSGL